VPVRRVCQDRLRRLQRREGQRQHAPKRRAVDRDGGRGQSTPGNDLGQQPAERVADHRGLAGELGDDRRVVISNLPNGFAGEHAGILVGFLDSARIVGPTRGDRGVAGFGEHGRPPVPTAGQ